jgi:DNA (cytosine-5)-methyltransferase 1
MHDKKRLLSLFSGCGGMDLGFEGGFKVRRESVGPTNVHWISEEHSDGWVTLKETGFQTVFANDVNRAAQAAWEPYFKGYRGNTNATFIHGSIVDLVKAHYRGEFQFPGNIDIVTGGFPCQDFSVAGKRKGFASHKAHHGQLLSTGDDCPTEENRGVLYKWMREVIAITQPKLFVAENVKGLVSLPDVQAIIAHDFASVGEGYIVLPPQVLHAARYGVPQTRERVIFIGVRKDCLTPLALKALTQPVLSKTWDLYPSPTHYLDSDPVLLKNNTTLLPWVSSGQALQGLLEPTADCDLAHQGYSKAKYMGPHCQGQRELDLTKPGPTIRSEHHGNIEFRRLAQAHGGQNLAELVEGLPERRLSVRECARLQTFPDDMAFVRRSIDEFRLSTTDGYKLVGNAVPPLLAYHLAMSIEKVWHRLFEDVSYDTHRYQPESERVRAFA